MTNGSAVRYCHAVIDPDLVAVLHDSDRSTTRTEAPRRARAIPRACSLSYSATRGVPYTLPLRHRCETFAEDYFVRGCYDQAD